MNWFLMGGYAWFVWPSYIACVLIMLWLAVSPYRRHRRTIEKLKNLSGVN